MKKEKMLVVLVLASMVFAACSVADKSAVSSGLDSNLKTSDVPSGYSLVWSDEFETAGQPNSDNWNYHVGNGYSTSQSAFCGWGNGEWEWYRPEHCYVSNGNLVIKGDYSTTAYYTVNGTSYYQKSGRLTSRGKKSFKYGYIEARIKNPTLQGNWTAFWMMGTRGGGDTYTSSYSPSDSYYDSMVTNWASCGEIDIMEHCADSTTGNNYCFWDTRTGVYAWTSGYNGDYGTTSAAYGDATAYHTYAILWTESAITWYVDGTQTWTVDTTASGLEEFQNPFYFIINLAIGGSLAGDVSTSGWPIYMYVDYVRVYQQGATASSSSSSSSSSVSSSSSSSSSISSSSSSISSVASSSSSSSSSTASTFTYGVTYVSSTSGTLWFSPGWTASWVDVHYKVNGGSQMNYSMSYNSTTARWEKTATDFASGAVVTYYFTYEKSGLAYDSATYTYTNTSTTSSSSSSSVSSSSSSVSSSSSSSSSSTITIPGTIASSIGSMSAGTTKSWSVVNTAKKNFRITVTLGGTSTGQQFKVTFNGKTVTLSGTAGQSVICDFANVSAATRTLTLTAVNAINVTKIVASTY